MTIAVRHPLPLRISQRRLAAAAVIIGVTIAADLWIATYKSLNLETVIGLPPTISRATMVQGLANLGSSPAWVVPSALGIGLLGLAAAGLVLHLTRPAAVLGLGAALAGALGLYDYLRTPDTRAILVFPRPGWVGPTVLAVVLLALATAACVLVAGDVRAATEEADFDARPRRRLVAQVTRRAEKRPPWSKRRFSAAVIVGATVVGVGLGWGLNYLTSDRHPGANEVKALRAEATAAKEGEAFAVARDDVDRLDRMQAQLIAAEKGGKACLVNLVDTLYLRRQVPDQLYVVRRYAAAAHAYSRLLGDLPAAATSCDPTVKITIRHLP
jgi:hypothetical protein